MAKLHESDGEQWPAIRRNYHFLSQTLHFSYHFLGLLFQERLISRDDFDALISDSLTREKKVRRLLLDVLPSKPPAMFTMLCDIFCSVGQPHVADGLMQNHKVDQICLRGNSRMKHVPLTIIGVPDHVLLQRQANGRK